MAVQSGGEGRKGLAWHIIRRKNKQDMLTDDMWDVMEGVRSWKILKFLD